MVAIKLNRVFPGWPRPLLGAAVFLLLLAACGSSEPTRARPAVEAANIAAAANQTPALGQTGGVGATGEGNDSDSSSATGGPGPIGEIDADVIVAAQEEALIRLYERLLPSVVHLRVSLRLDTGRTGPLIPRHPGVPLPDFPDEFFQRGQGSGFVWDDQGHVVTNNHVVEGANRVTVVFADGVEIQAKVIGADPDSDLAVLKLDDRKDGANPVVLGDSDALRVGQMAVAIGSPFGQQFTMTTGIVSALGRTIRSGDSPFSIPEVIQTDAPINPGNSGGPLLDRLGKVVGVNTQIISLSGVSSGIGLSVPINTAKRVIPTLIEDGRFEYSWLGITGTTLRPEVAEEMDLPQDTGGAQVIQVSGGSPADRAGLKSSDGSFTLEGVEYPLGGDIIFAIDGIAVNEMDDLIAYLVSKTRPGDKVTLEVIRGGQELETLEVTLGKRPDFGR